ncbi:hypothetical protein [Streptomyces sp. NPDC048442]|uniref:hypothetical protein n=1 Tax=Streptomyces sp. NPDC048442 TaxID=3154823 RepID=UPI00341E392C
MRPRLKEDVRFAPVEGGVFVQGSRGSFMVPGGGAGTWLERLAPHLTGEHSLAELTAGLSPKKGAVVGDLVRLLHRAGFVADAREDRPHGLSEEERREYADLIAFVGYALDSADHRFQRYRDHRLVVAGDGPLVAALVPAAVRTGCRRVEVVASGTAADQLAEQAAAVLRDRRQEVVLHASLDKVAALGEATVLHVCTGTDTGEVRAVAEHCSRSGAVLGQLLAAGDEAWIRPAAPAGPDAGSSWRRLEPATGPAGREGGADAWAACRLAGPVPALLAHQLLLGWFRRATGLAEPSASEPLSPGPGRSAPPGGTDLVRVDLRTLEASRHHALPHPADRPVQQPAHCLGTTRIDGARPGGRPGEARARAALQDRVSGAPADPQDLLHRAARAVDPRTGLLRAVDEGNLPQSPLWSCWAEPADPFRSDRPGAPQPSMVLGHGLDRDEARLRALLAGLAAYAALVVARPGPDDGLVWGQDLVTGDLVQVPAPRTRAGTAAGLSWAEAVLTGLYQQVERHVEQHAGRHKAHRPAGPLAAGAGERQPHERGERLLGLLHTIAAPGLRDLTELFGIPVCEVRIGPDTGLAAGPSWATARAAAAERALLAWQFRTAVGPGGSAAPELSTGAPTRPVPPGPQPWQPLAVALHARGLHAVAVPLDQDAQATALLPYLVQVVMTDARP